MHAYFVFTRSIFIRRYIVIIYLRRDIYMYIIYIYNYMNNTFYDVYVRGEQITRGGVRPADFLLLPPPPPLLGNSRATTIIIII